MPKWRDLWHKEEEYAKAAVDAKIDEKADPKVQIHQVIINQGEQHDKLTEEAANVVANNKMVEMRLNKALASQVRLTASAKQAKAAGHMDTARSFALQLATVNGQVEDLKAQHEQTQPAAEQAKEMVSDSAAALQQKISESEHLLAQVDQARMQAQMNETMKAVVSTANTATPSFDQIAQKVEGQFAKATSESELLDANPGMQAMHAHHQEINDEADAILAGLDEGSDTPALNA